MKQINPDNRVRSEELGVRSQHLFSPLPNTSLPEAAPTTSLRDAVQTSLSTSAQYFSTRGYANDFAQYKCPMPIYPKKVFNVSN
ncbi:hypothetical protein [Nostoc sp.]|uniref:hypothetical protein n=1 Tax=Nostoc sp. TaxID=1180 RepID=UPI002FF8967A